MKYHRRNPSAPRNADRKGVTIVEAALVLPMLVMISCGVVDYGYYMYLKNTFQGAAQAGARAAIPAAATNSNLTGSSGVITSMMTAAGVSSSNYTVTTTPASISGVSAGTSITVTITGTWSNIGTHMLPTVFGGIGSSKQVIGTAVMIKESS